MLPRSQRKCFKVKKLNSKNRQKYAEFKENLKIRITTGRIWFGANNGREEENAPCHLFLTQPVPSMTS